MDESCLQGSSTLHVTNGWVVSHVTNGWLISQVNESCPMWMSHVAHGWVVPGQQHTLSHVANGWVMSQVNESCPAWMSHGAHEWVMSHVWPRNSRKNRGCQVMSLILSDVINATLLILSGVAHFEISLILSVILSDVAHFETSLILSIILSVVARFVTSCILSDVTNGWVMSRMYWVMLCMNESCRVWKNHNTRVTSKLSAE